MFEAISRRGFLGMAPVMPFVLHGQSPAAPSATTTPASFPQQDPDLVKEMITVAHGNLPRVKELVAARPALARASWDWGYGDWETAIDAASHVGNRPIADYLIANGARPTIYTAAMMGQLAIVKGWVEAIPGVQRNRGPHGITLLAHARAGGPGAVEVVKYLDGLGDADPRYADVPITETDPATLAGEYTYGPGATERLKVARNARGVLTIVRPGYSERGLAHQGGLAFIPVGAEAVRIRFELADGKTSALTVEDGPVRVRARRE